MTIIDSGSTVAAAEMFSETPQLVVEQFTTPTKVEGSWSQADMQEHLQWAVNVEHYTIMYYMSAWFSIKDQASEAARLLKSIVNQEMAHMQSAANLANAFGTRLSIQPPLYGVAIPHLDFTLDEPDPTRIFTPYSTTIGPFDLLRLNTMCIIEFPEWRPGPHGHDSDEYGSIGELYGAIVDNIERLAHTIVGNNQQVDHFGRFYPDVQMTVTEDGEAACSQVEGLIGLIISQGEGQSREQDGVPASYQNAVDDIRPAADHYDKFTYLREQPLPETWELTVGDDAGKRAQRALLQNYGHLVQHMNHLFGKTEHGDRYPKPTDECGRPTEFGPTMYSVGAAISACWQHGALPMFSLPLTKLRPARSN
jgi:hypothetical protein